MRMILQGRLSTQVGIIFFLAFASAIGFISWDKYQDVAVALPKQINHEVKHDVMLISSSIANLVVYQNFYPLWKQMKKIQEQLNSEPFVKIISFAVVNGNHKVLAHSDAKHYPLMTTLDLGKQGLTWQGSNILVVAPILHPLSGRNLGTVAIMFDASFITLKQEAAEKQILAYLFLALALSIFLALGMRERVAKPLKKLMQLASKVGSGSFDSQGFQKQPKELRELADAMQQTDAIIVNKAKEIEQLAKVTEQADELVIITDISGVIQYVNPAFERVSGYSKEEVIGETPRIVKSGEHSGDYYARMWSTLLAGRIWKDDFKNRKKDGSIYEVTQTIAPLSDQHGSIEGFVAVQRDVTQQRRVEEKLHHTDRVESLGVLAGGIAHDFNNLLTAILGNASLALKKLDHSSPAYDNIGNIEAASHSAADLCRQMLAYSGKGKFVVKPVNLSVLVENMGKLIDVSIAKNVVMRYQLAKRLPLIDADIAQMQQVLLNLMTNASESIEDKSGIITLATGVMMLENDYLYKCIGEENLSAGRYVYLEVSDTGCGMDDATLKKIFDPFFTTKFTGRGLGMSAMLGIVRGHKGALRVYTERGHGTTIRVLFPESLEQHWEEGEVLLPKNIDVTGTVLIIDDEETVREVAAAMLEDIGFKSISAIDGADGVACYRKHQNDIAFVLLDMTMPKMNGEECFRHLRQINPDIKVILSSGYNEQEATSRFTGKGLAGFLQKPYSPQALADKITSMS
ncbi:MAG: PAS domain S-box protein [Mariprofundaceae bacterium]|nr:PAS domain S-box protein [Mariprofundaceae bacterium]